MVVRTYSGEDEDGCQDSDLFPVDSVVHRLIDLVVGVDDTEGFAVLETEEGDEEVIRYRIRGGVGGRTPGSTKFFKMNDVCHMSVS